MDQLTRLRRAVERRAVPGIDVSNIERLDVTRVGDEVHLDFYGLPFDESFADLLRTLNEPTVARYVASLSLRGPDEGSNGTRNWDLSLWADGKAKFPRLRYLSIEQTKPADHNRTIVAADYDEEGVLAKVLAKLPALESLTVPSAPNADFFRVGSKTLAHLNVDTGYDHQGFIANLAGSKSFPKLSWFQFGEYCETYMDDFAAHVTPWADYRKLFASRAFRKVDFFIWRNPACTEKQLQETRRRLKDCTVQVVRWSAEYLR